MVVYWEGLSCEVDTNFVFRLILETRKVVTTQFNVPRKIWRW